MGLLAESHVYTDEDDLSYRIVKEVLPPVARHIPDRFVRLVYCLAYGEDGLLDRLPHQRNSGTREYWEILGQCAGTWQGGPLSVQWKVQTLSALRDCGIWLVDACLHACMNPRLTPPWRSFASPSWGSLYPDLLQASWKYVKQEIEQASEIWYIGMNLRGVLRHAILDPSKYIPKPAGRKNPTTRREYEMQFPKLIEAARRACASIG